VIDRDRSWVELPVCGIEPGWHCVLPIIYVVLIAIQLVDLGRDFSMQDRYGMDGQCFQFIQLRTMRLHSDV
jgi:lipopolysaccharide/colanic/teichoic acid biosynthesis glycosyltransferase